VYLQDGLPQGREDLHRLDDLNCPTAPKLKTNTRGSATGIGNEVQNMTQTYIAHF